MASLGYFFTPPTGLGTGGGAHCVRGCRRDTDPARQQLGLNADLQEALQESGAGATQAGFTEEAASRLPECTAAGTGTRTSSARAEERPPRSGQAGVRPGVRRRPSPPRPRAQVEPAAPPGRALSPRGSRGPRRPRSGRVSRAETGAAPAPSGGDAAWQRGRRLRRPSSARVCVGSGPRRAAGRDERPFCVRPAAPLASHSS